AIESEYSVDLASQSMPVVNCCCYQRSFTARDTKKRIISVQNNSSSLNAHLPPTKASASGRRKGKPSDLHGNSLSAQQIYGKLMPRRKTFCASIRWRLQLLSRAMSLPHNRWMQV